MDTEQIEAVALCSTPNVHVDVPTVEERIQNALDMIAWGGVDGAHHKQWALDQALRALTGGVEEDGGFTATEEYKKWVAEYEDGDEGPNTYKWEEGIAP